MEKKISLELAQWKYGKEWVYSITYDEALAELERFVIPVHEELGIPGHLEVVAGHIGKIRDLGQSSFNGLRHMNENELRKMTDMGWGIGNHSFSHERVMDDPDRELKLAKQVIEDAIGLPVTVYTSPGNNDNLTPEVVEALKGYGYLAGMSITDDINLSDDDDLLWINRVPLHEKYWGVFDGAYDAYKRIQQAKEDNGWIVDYCHCPLEKAIHPYKDCTAAHHKKRLETVIKEGGDGCWYANPDEVVDYRYMRKYTSIKPIDNEQWRFVIDTDGRARDIQRKELTFILKGSFTCDVIDVFANEQKLSIMPAKAGQVIFSTRILDGMEIVIKRK
jgi:hypothetical protein